MTSYLYAHKIRIFDYPLLLSRTEINYGKTRSDWQPKTASRFALCLATGRFLILDGRRQQNSSGGKGCQHCRGAQSSACQIYFTSHTLTANGASRLGTVKAAGVVHSQAGLVAARLPTIFH